MIKAADGKERLGTVEDLQQGFINAVKAGLTDDGSQTEGFQRQAEEGFGNLFGTRSGSDIYNGWDKPKTGKTGTQTETASKSAYNVNGKDYSESDLIGIGYTKEQINQAIKLGTIKTK